MRAGQGPTSHLLTSVSRLSVWHATGAQCLLGNEEMQGLSNQVSRWEAERSLKEWQMEDNPCTSFGYLSCR